MKQHILITGGSDGIGKLTAHKLQALDFAVTILGKDEAKTQAAAQEIGCNFVVADVTDDAQVVTAFTQAENDSGPVDILINNAGVWLTGLLEENTADEIRRTLEVNTLGTIFCTQAVVPGMKQRGQGRIINVNSQAGIYAHPARSIYHASKWAVTGFTKALQEELKPAGVGIIGFYPGAMNTNFFAKSGDMKNRSNALDPEIATDALVYLCQLPVHVIVPELGIQSLEY